MPKSQRQVRREIGEYAARHGRGGRIDVEWSDIPEDQQGEFQRVAERLGVFGAARWLDDRGIEYRITRVDED